MKNHCVHVIGVDVAKAKLDIFDNQTKKHSIINNTAKEIKRFVHGILQHENQVLAATEATGGYEYLLRNSLLDADVACSVINPLQIRNFARGCGLIEKNDRLDARIIARFGEVVQPKIAEKPTENKARMKALVHRREQVLTQLYAENNRLQQTHDTETAAMIEQAIAFYKLQVKQIDQRIAEVIKTTDALKSKADIVTSVPGVGPATTAMLISELPELGTLSRSKIAKLVGVAPIARDSGTKQGKRGTFAGRSLVRKTLYMAALVATRFNPVMQSYYQRLLPKGKPKKVALVAVMRKLLVTLNCMVRNGETWRQPRETELAKVNS